MHRILFVLYTGIYCHGATTVSHNRGALNERKSLLRETYLRSDSFCIVIQAIDKMLITPSSFNLSIQRLRSMDGEQRFGT